MTASQTRETHCPPTEVVEECPLCASRNVEKLFATRDRLHRLPGEFGLVRCIDCQLIRLSPRPVLEHLGFYYPDDDYYSYQRPLNLGHRSANGLRANVKAAIRDCVMDWRGYPVLYLRTWQRALQPLAVRLFHDRIPYGYGDRFPKYKAGGHALEIGCGSGTYLGTLKHHGWQVAGVELSQAAGAAAKRELDVDVFVGDLANAPFAAETFDYVYMSHILEHLPEPLETLRVV